jgi:hypothetical protein
MRFRKKPVEVEAMRIEADNGNRNKDGSEPFPDPNVRSIAKVSGWLLGNGFRDFKVDGDSPFGIAIQTLEGVMVASPGDYIIRGVQGEFYPCKPDIFEATYEPATEPEAPRIEGNDS